MMKNPPTHSSEKLWCFASVDVVMEKLIENFHCLKEQKLEASLKEN
jgi:hypothetical protein